MTQKIRVQIKETGIYPLLRFGLSRLEKGTILTLVSSITEGSLISTNVCLLESTGERFVLGGSEIVTVDEEMQAKLKAMTEQKSLNIAKQRDKVKKETEQGLRPSKYDHVVFTVSNKDGSMRHEGVLHGIVMDVNYPLDGNNPMYEVLEKSSGITMTVVPNHRNGWYSGDTIRTEKSAEKSFQYYGVYDTRHDKVDLDSLFAYKEDTENYLRSTVGTPAPEYLEVRSIRMVVEVK